MSLARKDKDVTFTAGFPNAAVEAADIPLDLNELVVKNRSSTFYLRADGDQWSDANIYSGDVLVVDRSLEMQSHDLIIAQIDGELIMRHYLKKGPRHYLADASGNQQQLTDEISFELWGVITYSFHNHRRDA